MDIITARTEVAANNMAAMGPVIRFGSPSGTGSAMQIAHRAILARSKSTRLAYHMGQL
jgi:hypothetical protein